MRGHGQTAVVVADWLRAWTDSRRGCGLDKATASRPNNGADISRLNRDHFADIRTLKMQGVRRPLPNPHKIVWALELASTCAIANRKMMVIEVCKRLAALKGSDEARWLAEWLAW